MNSKTQTLITRSSTALVFVAVVLAAIFHSHLTRSVLLFFIFFGASFEYLKMFSKQSIFLLIFYSFIIAFVPFSLMELWPTEADLFKYFTIPVIIFYILNIYNLYSKKDILRHHSNLWIFAPLYFGFAYLSSIFLFEHDYLMDDILIQVIVLIWICDSAAYLVGSQIGKTKLFPSISPNKTWEGSIGAGIFTIIAGFVINKYFRKIFACTMHKKTGTKRQHFKLLQVSTLPRKTKH